MRPALGGWLLALAAVLTAAVVAPGLDGTSAVSTVALGSIKGPGNPPDPGPGG
jgi:hypothetical protein